MPDLTPKQAAFVAEYLKNGGDATKAARKAGYAHPDRQGHRLLSNVEISKAVASILPAAVLSDAERVVQRWRGVGYGDARELVEYRRGACRWCHGVDGRYTRTPAEREQAWGEHQEMVADALRGAKSSAMLKAIPQFDELGGSDYDRNRAPNPACLECGGDGVGRTIIADTRTLSPEAAALYAGIDVTRDGVKVRTHDSMAALAALAKFAKLAGHTPDPGDGAPQVVLHLHLVKALEGLSAEEREAARPLLARLAGSGKAG